MSMQRIALTAGFILMFSIMALAQGPAANNDVTFLWNAGPGAYFGVPAYFGPSTAYWGPYYRPSLSRQQLREAERLRAHQWRERYACRHSSYDGRCRNLVRHQRNEWRRFQRHDRREDNRHGWRRNRW
jgi:hypothetical protein